jgi:hypothetical protein
MTDHESLQWQSLYQKALDESNPEVLPADIARAEAAMHSRLKCLSKHAKDEAERHAISDALGALSVMKEQHFPGWGKSAKQGYA